MMILVLSNGSKFRMRSRLWVQAYVDSKFSGLLFAAMAKMLAKKPAASGVLLKKPSGWVFPPPKRGKERAVSQLANRGMKAMKTTEKNKKATKTAKKKPKVRKTTKKIKNPLYVRHGVLTHKSRRERAHYKRCFSDVLRASTKDIVDMLLEDKLLRDRTGELCPHCNKGS